jgi:large subunit ribosomal protein L9
VRSSRSVDVVLVEQLDTLGHKGQLVSVKPGYARNFLVPSGIAKYATPDTIAQHQVRLTVRNGVTFSWPISVP